MKDEENYRIQNLLDKDAIRDVIMRYARGVDRLDEDLISSCYHVDSYDDHGHWKGPGKEFGPFFVENLPKRAHNTTHAVGNVLIELDPKDPNLAYVESYSLAHLRRTDENSEERLDFFSGRYIDRFEKRDGEWKIAKRVVVHDWSTSTALTNDAFHLPIDGFTQGTRGSKDLVYQR
tara:strand:+ start:331 stop:858 length:528 start_codon:yes stop_codon:yes gene_type:complete